MTDRLVTHAQFLKAIESASPETYIFIDDFRVDVKEGRSIRSTYAISRHVIDSQWNESSSVPLLLSQISDFILMNGEVIKDRMGLKRHGYLKPLNDST